MDKETFKRNVIEIINDMHKAYLEQAEKVIDKMTDKELEEFDTPFFAPKTFYDALVQCNSDNISQRHYTAGFVRRYKKTLRQFINQIIYNRF